MPQDPEEKAAYEALEAAIEAVSRIEEAQGVLTEWVVLTAYQRFDDDGDGITQYGQLVPQGGGQIPHHRVMGLLDFQLARMRTQAAED